MRDILIAWKDAAPAIGALVAVISAVVAFSAFVYTRRANRRRATLDIVMKTLLDEGARAKYHRFRDVMRRAEDPHDCFKIGSVALDEPEVAAERRTILEQLNVYELMALGIRRGLFDEAFYKRWYHNQFMTDYEGARELISHLQQHSKPSIYCEFSTLYAKWLKAGHPLSSTNRIKMTWWAVTKQNEKIDAARRLEQAR